MDGAITVDQQAEQWRDAQRDADLAPGTDQGPQRVRVQGDLFHGRVPASAVYVGRAAPGLRRSPYANPFRAAAPGERPTAVGRAAAVRRFREWICGQPELLARARAELAGRDLACWCPPGPCHAEELVQLCSPALCSPALRAPTQGRARR